MTQHNGDSGPITMKAFSFWLAIIILISGMAVAWGTINEEVVTLRQHVQEQKEIIASLEGTIRDHEKESKELEIRLVRIEVDLAYIRTWIEKQEK